MLPRVALILAVSAVALSGCSHNAPRPQPTDAVLYTIGQVFVLDSPRSRPRRLYDAGPAHFDWITWSPDGTRLLLDDYGRGRWLLLRAKGGVGRRVLPELGGQPLWCCPVNAYSAGGTIRNS